MAWVVAHDVVPGLTALEPPPLQITDWLRNEGRQSQFAISNQDGRLGTMWTTYLIDRHSVQRTDLIWIDRFPVAVAPLRISIDSVFTADGKLDEFTVRLANIDLAMKLHGERFHSDFSFSFEMGPEPRVSKLYKMPLTEGELVSGAISPFAQLIGLEVGQTWRMQVFNPLAAMTGFGNRFQSVLVEVTGEEQYVVGDRVVDCMVVEANGAKAWIDGNGSVQAQQVSLPLAGQVRLVREEPFDNGARVEAKRYPLMTPIRTNR